MNEQQRCPQLREGSKYPSPFTRVVALGYYDGATEGVLQGGPGGSVYLFRMLAWDEQTQDLRVFELAPLPPSALEQLEKAFAPYESPRSPFWLPSWHEGIDDRIGPILQQAGPAEWVVAAEDLLGEITAARSVNPEDLARVTDWASFLSLGGQPHLASTEGLFPTDE